MCLVHQVLPTAQGVPGWSPIQVLTPLVVFLFQEYFLVRFCEDVLLCVNARNGIHSLDEEPDNDLMCPKPSALSELTLHYCTMITSSANFPFLFLVVLV